MPACSICGVGDRNSPDEIRTWTENLSDLMSSKKGRAEFHNFLTESTMEKGLKSLHFLEMCDNFLNIPR
jgi:hypothetical protein